MFNNNELAEYCARRGLSAPARTIIDRVRGSRPSRRVKSGIKNVACRFASRKMGCVIQAESHHNELPAIVGWEWDPQTFEFYDQPPRIKVSYRTAKGRSAAYPATPDYFLLQQDFVGWVECKTEEWLQAQAAEASPRYLPDGPGRWRFPPGEEYAAQYGLGFRVRSSVETNWTAVRNAEFLTDYLDVRTPKATADQRARVASILGGNAWIRLKDLLEADPAKLSADAIFGLIAQGHLCVDLARDLLAQPECTFVFRDELAAKAYRVQIESSQLPAISQRRSVSLVPGEPLMWDGKLWRIANVGDQDVFLVDDERTITSLPCKVIQKLVSDGTISGLPQDLTTRWDEVSHAIRRTGPAGFEEAMRRYYSIFPERGDGAPPAGKERVLRKWRAAYRLAAETSGFGLIGLFPRTQFRGNRERKLDERVIEIMDDVIDTHYAKKNGWSVRNAWGYVRNLCGEECLPPPSEQSFRKQIARRKRYDVERARNGDKAVYDLEEFQWYLEATSPRHGERPFEIGHIDHTELDLQFVGSRRGENLAKAWLTLLLDATTRVILAWCISFEPPSYRSCMRVIRECVRRHGRIPKTLVVDKGSEFESTYFETLLAFFESHKKTRPGAKPRYGSVIERIFGVSNQALIHSLAGNNVALQKPREMSQSHDPRLLAVWTLPAFAQAFERYLERAYHAVEHPAHGMPPEQAMKVGLALAGNRGHTLIPYTQDLVVMCLPTTKKGSAKVDSARGVKLNYVYYFAAEFRDPRLDGKSVPVRYDPEDASRAFAFVLGKWVPCRSELASEFAGRSEREIEIATQELQARNRRSSTRRAITASTIAQVLAELSGTEKALTERKRHLESLAAQDPTYAAPLGADTPADPAVAQDPWQDLELKFFGDFTNVE